MFSRFKPKTEVFYGLFNSASQCLVVGTRTLSDFLDPTADLAAITETMVELEHECDRITHDVFRTLNSTFVTPFDRSDIYTLGSSLDDVMDHMEAAAHLISLYRVPELPEPTAQLISILNTCADVTADAMPRLSSMSELEKYWIRINELENDADRIYRTLLGDLFNGQLDALTVLKHKDIGDELEDAVDAFEKVANVVEAIVLKES